MGIDHSDDFIKAHPLENEANISNGETTPLIRKDAPPDDPFTQVLPTKKLIQVFAVLAFVLLTAYLDQTCVSTAIPAIAEALDTGPSISWVGAAFLASSTAVQLINGRLSDIFGRKSCLITALMLMGTGNLLSGFSVTPTQLYLTRALSGVGAGALNALVFIILSDITTLKMRGHLFGIIGTFVALGNGLGPLVGGVLTEKAGWQWAFWFISPMSYAAVILLLMIMPGTPLEGSTVDQLKRVDWAGLITNILATLLILIPLSEGGVAFAFDSPMFIGMLTTGCALLLVFLVIEWKFAALPVVPLRLFANGLSANIFLIQNFLYGFVYWGNLFFMPMYLQNMRGFNPGYAGTLMLPLVISHGLFSGVSGSIMSWTGHYKPVIIVGSGVFAFAQASQYFFYDRMTSNWVYVAVGILEGFGLGFTLQPILVGLMGNSLKVDRACMTCLRNFVRAIGGAVGVVAATGVLNNTIQLALQGRIPQELINELLSSLKGLDKMPIPDSDKELVRTTYMDGVSAVFLIYVPIIFFCFVTSWLVKDRGLKAKDEDGDDDMMDFD